MAIKAFGKNPSGEELEKVKLSPNYSNDIFSNLHDTPMMTSESPMIKQIWRFMNKPAYTAPPNELPSVRTDLKNIKEEKPVIVWFGHSSYLIHVNGKNILVDPVFSGHASPFSFFAKSFPGSNVYSVDDMPPIDILIITHDHYDHMDYETVTKLKSKTSLVCTSLGIGTTLSYWGFDKNKIIEFDWWNEKQIDKNIFIAAAPARHFSGRSLSRYKTLWSSFVLKAGNYSFYIGADSGYDTHFKQIGHKYGPFEIAMLETGQYNDDWRYIHMMPEQAIQAAIDLKTKVLLPVHWAKFALALHPWDEPIKRVVAKAKELNVPITTPLIGEQVIIDKSYPHQHWWETVY
jgi:L-ascorbate metabolism protein UlaG (beta-lactamase superfamily)